jgi:hypothetical protein
VKDGDGIDLEAGDFRAKRRYLAPWLFANGEEGETYPPPTDLVDEEGWDAVMTLPTDVALKSTSYEGSLVARMASLHTDWIFSWPAMGTAPFMDEVSLLAAEEFDALVFNAAHGYYRQAIGCLRNALEVLMVAASLAVTGNDALFQKWRVEGQEISFGQARAWLRDSADGAQVDADADPQSVFGDADTSWTKARYSRLCGYAHSQAGYNNADFWESNGPVFSPQALQLVEAEFRETLALGFLLLRLGWPGYAPGPGEPNLLAGPQDGWGMYDGLLRTWLTVP